MEIVYLFPRKKSIIRNIKKKTYGWRILLHIHKFLTIISIISDRYSQNLYEHLLCFVFDSGTMVQVVLIF